MRIRSLNHSVYEVLYHIVWGTKYRRKILKTYVRQELINAFKTTQRKSPDLYFHKINAADDHIHIVMEIPPKYAVSSTVQKLKSQSAAYLKTKFKFVKEMKGEVWGTGFFVSTIGLNEDVIKKYVERQNQEDRGRDISAEFS